MPWKKDDSEGDCQVGQLRGRLRLQLLELMEVFTSGAVSLLGDWVAFTKSHCFYGISDLLVYGSGMMASQTELPKSLA